MSEHKQLGAGQIVELARELLRELESFVESDGDTSYLSTEEKESQCHILAARKLIVRARRGLEEGSNE